MICEPLEIANECARQLVRLIESTVGTLVGSDTTEILQTQLDLIISTHFERLRFWQKEQEWPDIYVQGHYGYYLLKPGNTAGFLLLAMVENHRRAKGAENGI